jgi:folate-binding protein YgfZ
VFSGADRLRYLNGQLTQDLKKLVPGRALPACVTSAKGRLQADVWVAFTDDSQGPVAVDAAPELREALAARLDRYIVADDVALEDATGGEALLHCVGFAAPESVEGATGDAGSAGAEGAPRAGLGESGGLPEALSGFPRIAAARLGQDGWDIWVPSAAVDSLKSALGELLASEGDWERRRILQGIPEWGKELDENTLPPEAGLERTHIDYHKGCYIGQEVISRLKSVGHVNRTLRRFVGRAPESPAPGAVFLSEAGAEAGVLTSVAKLEDGAFVALGYVKRSHEAERVFTVHGVRIEAI